MYRYPWQLERAFGLWRTGKFDEAGSKLYMSETTWGEAAVSHAKGFLVRVKNDPAKWTKIIDRAKALVRPSPSRTFSVAARKVVTAREEVPLSDEEEPDEGKPGDDGESDGGKADVGQGEMDVEEVEQRATMMDAAEEYRDDQDQSMEDIDDSVEVSEDGGSAAGYEDDADATIGEPEQDGDADMGDA